MTIGEIKLGGFYSVRHDGFEKIIRLTRVGRRGGWFGSIVNSDSSHGSEVFLEIGDFLAPYVIPSMPAKAPPRPAKRSDYADRVRQGETVTLLSKSPPKPLVKAPPKPVGHAENPVFTPAKEFVKKDDLWVMAETIPAPMAKAPPRKIKPPAPVSLDEDEDRQPTRDWYEVPPATVPPRRASANGPMKLSEILARSAPTTANGNHLIINALAGTGKTTTLFEAVNRIGGTKKLNGSEEQEAIFEEILRQPKPTSICMLAFNKSIATVLQEKIGSRGKASTIHSLAFGVMRQAYPMVEFKKYRSGGLLEEFHGESFQQLSKQDPLYVSACLKISGLAKLTLCENDPEEFSKIVNTYDIELSPKSGEKCYDTVKWMLNRAQENVDGYDFDDAIWLSVIKGLPIPKFDLLCVDEMQDLNRLQQEFVRRVGRRMIGVGDKNQAIYGFAGADVGSMGRMKMLLDEDGNCTELPLTMTRRCGAAIVEEARTIVPAFRGCETNGPGLVIKDVPQDLADKETQVGDMVLCRINAPLVSLCFRYIKLGKKAVIKGRSIGEGIQNFINHVLRPANIENLVEKIETYRGEEEKRLYRRKWVDENQIINMHDKCDCIVALTENCKSLEDITKKIDGIFSDESQGTGIMLSSMHRAKGLEADRVWIREPRLLPHPMAKVDWQREQEDNLKYVGVTRAKKELRFVRDTPQSISAPEL